MKYMRSALALGALALTLFAQHPSAQQQQQQQTTPPPQSGAQPPAGQRQGGGGRGRGAVQVMSLTTTAWQTAV
jgi:hypothetical protein